MADSKKDSIRFQYPVTPLLPNITSSGVALRLHSIFSFLRARSCMIWEAQSSSLRCTTRTSEANRVKNCASSIAVSPPPKTVMFLMRKKNPSQVAHVLTPWPIFSTSPGIPIIFAEVPVEKITASAVNSAPPSKYNVNGVSILPCRSLSRIEFVHRIAWLAYAYYP